MTEEMQAISDLTKQIAILEKHLIYTLLLLGDGLSPNGRLLLKFIRSRDEGFDKVGEKVMETTAKLEEEHNVKYSQKNC